MNATDRYPLDLSVILPVYNEVESLLLLHRKISEAVAPLGLAYEVIYVDDGSTDGSTDALLELRHGDPRVVVAVQRRNFGKSAALSVGFALARGRIIVTLDADLQDEPAEIPKFLARLEAGCDVVSGWKQVRHDPLSKRLPSWVANRATSLLTGVNLHDMNSGFKAYRVQAVRRIYLYGDLHRYIPVLAHYAGFRVAEIPVVHHARQFGRSKYGPGRFLRGGLDLITVVFLNQYGRRPLHLFGGVGGLMLLVGFVINLYLTIEWFGGIRPLSERPLLTLGVLLMVMGVQLVTLGLLAELIVSFMQRSDDPLKTTEQIYRAETAGEVENGIP
jgi:glycosyltransferase involved in cell wall biosynthesis